MSFETFGDRMKAYEEAGKTKLINRLPVIIRVDGRAFHTLTRGRFEKPFSRGLHICMLETAKALCEEVSNTRLAYVQSDEISLVVLEKDEIESKPWFGNERDKVITITASIATEAFNEQLKTRAHFDSRAFNLPPHEVINYFIWRQRDAIRNSVSALAQAHFSQKEIEGLNGLELKELIKSKKEIDWDATPIMQQRGSCIVYNKELGSWVTDTEIPLFGSDRSYIENRIKFESRDENND